MFTYQRTCPKCREISDFPVPDGSQWHPRSRTASGYSAAATFDKHSDIPIFSVTACPKCAQPTLLFFTFKFGILRQFGEAIVWNPQLGAGLPVEQFIRMGSGDLKDNSTTPVASLPEDWKPFSAPGVPADILKQFTSAQHYLNSAAPTFDGVLIQCRKVVELACKHLLSKGSAATPTGDLKSKIDQLASKGIVTPTLSDWAHTIRLLGNEGAHGSDATREEAEEMVEFTRIFLEYVFVLPERIEKIRKLPEKKTS